MFFYRTLTELLKNKDENLSSVSMWMDLEDIMASKINQIKKMVLLIWSTREKKVWIPKTKKL